MSTVEITRVEDVRDGDRVTLTRNGTVVTGEVIRVGHRGGESRTCFEMSGMGYLAVYWAGGGSWEFVRATRQVSDLPTEPGSVIAKATVRGVEGQTAILDPEGDWFTTECIDGHYYHDPEDITAWEPGRIVSEED